MEIKDFKVGQAVYVIKYKSDNPLVEEWTVTKVGKKYLYAKSVSGFEYVFELPFSDKNDYLVQKSEYSPDYYLYKTEEKIRARAEHKKKVAYVREFLHYKMHLLTYEQIDGIYEIMKQTEEK